MIQINKWHQISNKELKNKWVNKQQVNPATINNYQQIIEKSYSNKQITTNMAILTLNHSNIQTNNYK